MDTAEEAHKRNSEENPAHIFLNSEIKRFEEGTVSMQSLCGVVKFTRGFAADDLEDLHRCPKCIEIAEGATYKND